jgi:CRISPR-associated exonuclease Cas4
MTTTNQPTESDDYPPLSGLNHLLFCERRCALLRIEGVWVENVHTIGGTLDHRRAHTVTERSRASVRAASGLRLVSHRLRLTGVADLVEFRRQGPNEGEVPYPVEYKRGRRKRWDNDEIQLCAQAMCLEEMLGVSIPTGAIYHITSRARREVEFTSALRAKTEAAATRLHELLDSRRVPAPELKPRCRGCSMRGVCLPEVFDRPDRLKRLAARLFQADLSDPPPAR